MAGSEKRVIDLRRDTITLPDDRMRRAAFSSPLGDSVYGEDPVQRELESAAAAKVGMEAAIFLPSGTMGNLVALLAHTERGQEVILEQNSHIRTSETGGAASVAGLMLKTVAGPSGLPSAEDLRQSVRRDDIHYPQTGLIALEQPHYRYGGIVAPLQELEAVAEVAREFALPVHLDGARIFNACLYMDVGVEAFAARVDSIMISLSKGLGAPVGSVLCGSTEFISRAARYRKMLGGGMRQTGWLCACGLLALSEEYCQRLSEDHQNAHRLAQGLNEIGGLNVRLDRVHTNFVLVELAAGGVEASSLLASLEAAGVRATLASEDRLRFVTSKEVSSDDIEQVINICRTALR